MEMAIVKIVSDGRGYYNFSYKGEFLLPRYVPGCWLPFFFDGVRDLSLRDGIQVVYLFA